MVKAAYILKGHNPGAVFRICRHELESFRFDGFKGTTLWRQTNVKFDVLKFDMISKAHCEKWKTPFGSFSLQPSCLFSFLPRLGHVVDKNNPQPERGFGQVRLAISRGIWQPLVKTQNIWWAGSSDEEFDAVVQDVLNKITDMVIPFFIRFDDPQELLRTLIEDEDAIGHEGVWDIGKKMSPARLLYTGFAAIECRNWELASSSFNICRDKILAIPEPIGEHIRTEMLPLVHQGFACAMNQSAWEPN